MRNAPKRDRPPTQNADNAEWYEACYEQIVANKAVQTRALTYAQAMRGRDDPEIVIPDVQGSRAYLRACVLNMSVAELSEKKTDEFAALWARGALGAAKYRSGRTLSKLKRRKPRDRPDSDD
ncbi:MAG: hypothetical protein ABI548_10160 [Polyangiaceae bacterium]